jgi:MFS family permease
MKSTAQIFVGVMSCVLASGVIYGYAALKPELIDEGVYSEECKDEPFDGVLGGACYKQDLRLVIEFVLACRGQANHFQRLNLMFTMASILTNVSALPAGMVLDRYGPKAASIAGCIFMFCGTILIGVATYAPFDAWLLGYLFLALGGTFIFVPSFHLSNAFPNQAGTVLALITGAFDASAFVLFIFRILYASIPAITISNFFAIYTVVPIIILIAQLTIMPSKPYNSFITLEKVAEVVTDAANDHHESDDDLESIMEVRKVQWRRRERRMGIYQRLKKILGSKTEREERLAKIERVQKQSDVWGMLHGRTPVRQMKSRWFILITIFTIITMLRMNFFIQTIRSQYEYLLGDDEQAQWLNELFDASTTCSITFILHHDLTRI